MILSSKYIKLTILFQIHNPEVSKALYLNLYTKYSYIKIEYYIFFCLVVYNGSFRWNKTCEKYRFAGK